MKKPDDVDPTTAALAVFFIGVLLFMAGVVTVTVLWIIDQNTY